MKTLECSPPAKINLVLQVLDRRRQGLHVLDTVIQAVSWRDDLTLTKRLRPGIDFTSAGLRMGPVDENLAVRAAQALLDAQGIREGLRIRLKKTIPPGAGLGGGSSDAASVLMGINRLWELGLRRQTLAPLALQLGSDVPFFLWGGTARVEGVGERITPWPTVNRGALVLVSFPQSLSTKEAYRALDRRRADKSPHEGLTAGRRALNKWRIWFFAPDGTYPRVDAYNDFSPMVRARFRRVHEMWERLQEESGGCVGMTGKGPTLFAWVSSTAHARTLQAVVERRVPSTRIKIVSPLPSTTIMKSC